MFVLIDRTNFGTSMAVLRYILQKLGGIGLLSGAMGISAAIITLLVGWFAAGMEAPYAWMVVDLGWGEILLSFLAIIIVILIR